MSLLDTLGGHVARKSSDPSIGTFKYLRSVKSKDPDGDDLWSWVFHFKDAMDGEEGIYTLACNQTILDEINSLCRDLVEGAVQQTEDEYCNGYVPDPTQPQENPDADV